VGVFVYVRTRAQVVQKLGIFFVLLSRFGIAYSYNKTRCTNFSNLFLE